MTKGLKLIALLLALTVALGALVGCDLIAGLLSDGNWGTNPTEPYKIVNNNVPYFTDDEITTKAYEKYSELDSLGRCGVVMACVGRELMPKGGEERESISSVTPSGWEQAKYDSELVDGGFLYNRAHLIGWQLTAENANKRNLITGTRYFNVDGMLPFENLVADYVRETGNHVMYRVTPDFEDSNLVATGVTMEAYSVEDNGDGVQFCIYVYNFQPGILIDYATGKSRLDDGTGTPTPDAGGTDEGEKDDTGTGEPIETTYILNTSSKKFHDPDCAGAATMKEENKQTYTGSRDDLIDEGYTPCGTCKP